MPEYQPQRENNTRVRERENQRTNQFIHDEDQENRVDDTLYRVVVLNNEETSFQAVVDVLMAVFGHAEEVAHQIMEEAHNRNFAICWIGAQNECDQMKTRAENYCQGNADSTIDEVPNDMGEGNRPHYYDRLEFEIQEHQEDV